MAELSQLIGEDSRAPIERLRRFQLHRIADSFDLQYPVGASKDVMIKLFEAHNIDVTQSAIVQWQVMNGVDTNGKPRQELYPVDALPNSMRNGANAAAALNEVVTAKDKEDQAFEEARLDVLQRENEQLKRTNEQLKGVLETRLAALEGGKQPQKEKSEYWDAYKKAKDMNLPVKRGMKLVQIEEMIANG